MPLYRECSGALACAVALPCWGFSRGVGSRRGPAEAGAGKQRPARASRGRRGPAAPLHSRGHYKGKRCRRNGSYLDECRRRKHV